MSTIVAFNAEVTGSVTQQGPNQPEILKLPKELLTSIAQRVATGRTLLEARNNATAFRQVCVATFRASNDPAVNAAIANANKVAMTVKMAKLWIKFSCFMLLVLAASYLIGKVFDLKM